MNERENIVFYKGETIGNLADVKKRSEADFLSAELKKVFPNENIVVKQVAINTSGRYKKIKKRAGNLPGYIHAGIEYAAGGLPPYIDVRIEHVSGGVIEKIAVWVPVEWNKRFIGTGGGGTQTGGINFVGFPSNTQRGMSLSKALVNHFASATTDAGNRTKEWAVDKKTSKLDKERIENWRARSTHFMTLIGKAVTEIIHGVKVEYSYFHGGSGGGRQALVEAQEFPLDYNGVWASCPAVYWNKIFFTGLWAIAVMNEYKHPVPPEKMNFIMQAVHESVGGTAQFLQTTERVVFDANTLIGKETPNGKITIEDAKIVNLIWEGPKDETGKQLYVGLRPGVLCWNVGIPVGGFWYTLLKKIPKNFFLTTHYLRWLTENPKETFDKVGLKRFYELYRISVEKFADSGADIVDLQSLKNAGHKLMIDHGTCDPLLPVDGVIDYCEKVKAANNGAEDFFRLFITPGDGHGSCDWFGPGITERDGMTALIDWVEKGIAPEEIRTVKINGNLETVLESSVKRYQSGRENA